jgi:hypothetical protein
MCAFFEEQLVDLHRLEKGSIAKMTEELLLKTLENYTELEHSWIAV